jgi:hypothetical protein
MVSSATGRLVRLQARRQPSHLSHTLNYNGRYHGFATADLHSFALRRTDDDDDNKRYYHTTAPSERAAAMMMGLASVSALAYAGSSAVQSYNEWKAAQPSPEESEKMEQAEAEERAKQEAQRKTEEKEAPPKQKQAPRENVFKQWFGVGVGSKYYEGGFEDTMTKREAALILGVRESSPAQRIKDAHRKLLILNHPDTGGSTYLSGKLNEAKELLLKGKGRVKT